MTELLRINYRIPTLYLSAISNGDTTGLSNEDEIYLSKFYDELNEVKAENNASIYLIGVPSDSDEPYFSSCNDIDELASDVYDVDVVFLNNKS